jgi:hypothetical protein
MVTMVTLKLDIEHDTLHDTQELAAFRSTLSAGTGAVKDYTVRDIGGSSTYCAGYNWHLMFRLYASPTAAPPTATATAAPAYPANTADGVGADPGPVQAGTTGISCVLSTVKGGLYVMCNLPPELRALKIVTHTHSCKMGAAGLAGCEEKEVPQLQELHRAGSGHGFAGFFMNEGAQELASWDVYYLRDGCVLRAHAELRAQ